MENSTLPRLWITGISGFLGWHLAQAMGDWQVYGTYCTHPVHLPNGLTTALELTDTKAVTRYYQTIRPDAIIHTAACSKVNVCQQAPGLSQAINVTATQHLAELAAAANIPLVFTSTDLVFNGEAAPYTETDPPTPINRYGEQKAAAEQLLLAIHPQAVICRLSLLFGVRAPQAQSFLTQGLEQVAAGQSLSLFTDEFRTPVDVEAAIAGLRLALHTPGLGRLHLGGPERLSRYQFGQLMATTWEIPSHQLRPCRQADIPGLAPRPHDVSLNSDKARQLGYQPTPLGAALEKIRRIG